ncbi:MAG: XRE family transcriptional regulator [Betaproteobacteria bacterium RIFCSPLOWO2_12_FULL_65_14]|nr:MAG: XRE family transcriptional regulator [Betaproteobacteria bacterium RIFCSPLOWO2_12_FULL_65_14]
MKRSGQDILVRLGQAVRRRRTEMDLSQESLAERADLHRTYVADIERGVRNVSLKNIEKLARALEVSIADLFASIGKDDQR